MFPITIPIPFHTLHTGCSKKVGTPKYLRKYKFYRKVFQTKVIWFKNIHLLILSVWPWVA